MNINYEKKIKKEEKKIADYNAKIKNIYDKYETEIFSDDELQNADLIMVQYYRKVIEGCNARIDEYQEKAAAQVRGGLEISNKSNKKKALISLVSVVGVGLLLFSACNTFNNNDGKDNQNDDSYQDEDEIKDTKDPLEDEGLTFGDDSEPEESKNDLESKEKDESNKVESLYPIVLTDINDEEQVYARAKYIKENYYDVYLPQQYVTVQDVEEQIRQIGAGICEEVSFESANNAIVVVNDLMFREEGDATDRVNSVTTTREETLGTLDLGLFCVDGTKGQILLHQLSELRTGMIQGAGKEDISDLQKEYTELFLSSTLLQGYNSIDINSLETGGMKYLTGIAFLNTATLCGDFNQVKVENPLTLETTSLQSVIDEFNNAECSTTMITENGEPTYEEVTLNYLGTYFFEMVSDNYTTKSMYGEDFGYKLK